jgi:hypothetical protein
MTLFGVAMMGVAALTTHVARSAQFSSVVTQRSAALALGVNQLEALPYDSLPGRQGVERCRVGQLRAARVRDERLLQRAARTVEPVGGRGVPKYLGRQLGLVLNDRFDKGVAFCRTSCTMPGHSARKKIRNKS